MKDIPELLAQLTAKFGHLIKNISIVELTTHACKAQPVMKIDGKLFSC